MEIALLIGDRITDMPPMTNRSNRAGEATPALSWDIFPDTWVATDDSSYDLRHLRVSDMKSRIGF